MESVRNRIAVSTSLLVLSVVVMCAEASLIISCQDPLAPLILPRLSTVHNSALYKLYIREESTGPAHDGKPQYKVDITTTDPDQPFSQAALTLTTTGACGVGQLRDEAGNVYEMDDAKKCRLPISLQADRTGESMTHVHSLVWTPPSCGCVQFRAWVVETQTMLYGDQQDIDNGQLTTTVCVHRQTKREHYINAVCKAQARYTPSEVADRSVFLDRHNVDVGASREDMLLAVKERMHRLSHCCGKATLRSQSRCMERVRFQRVDAYCQRGMPEVPFTSLRSYYMKGRERSCCIILGSHRYSCFKHKSEFYAHTPGVSNLDYSLDELDPLNDLADFILPKDDDILEELSTAHMGLLWNISLEQQDAHDKNALSFTWGIFPTLHMNDQNLMTNNARQSSERRFLGGFSTRFLNPLVGGFGRSSPGRSSAALAGDRNLGRASQVLDGHSLRAKQTQQGTGNSWRTSQISPADNPRLQRPDGGAPGFAGDARDVTADDGYDGFVDPPQTGDVEGGRSSALVDEFNRMQRQQRRLEQRMRCCYSGSKAGEQLFGNSDIDIIEKCMEMTKGEEADVNGCYGDLNFYKCCMLNNKITEMSSREVRRHLGMTGGGSREMGRDLLAQRRDYDYNDADEDEEGVGVTGDGQDEVEQRAETRYRSMRRSGAVDNVGEDEEEEEDGPQRFDRVDNIIDDSEKNGDSATFVGDKNDVLFRRNVSRTAMPSSRTVSDVEPDPSLLDEDAMLYRKRLNIGGGGVRGVDDRLSARADKQPVRSVIKAKSKVAANEETDENDDRDFVDGHQDDDEEEGEEEEEEEKGDDENEKTAVKAVKKASKERKLRQRTKSSVSTKTATSQARRRASRERFRSKNRSRLRSSRQRSSLKGRRSRERTRRRNSQGGRSRKNRRTSGRRRYSKRASREREARIPGTYRTLVRPRLNNLQGRGVKAQDSIEMSRNVRRQKYGGRDLATLDSKEQSYINRGLRQTWYY